LELTANLYYNDLVERCKKGDVRSYGHLYEQYAKAMYSTCFRLLNDRTEAEDVLQEAFSEAFRHLSDFQYKSSFGAWLKQIVINKSINHLRKKKLALTELNEQVHESVIDEDQVDEEEIQFQINEIKKAIQQLAPGYRAVLSLYLLEGYDHEEIAEIMGITYSTTRTQYKRAKDKLIALLKMKRK
jgi:RNA polymerase sigma-70 factor (ECF subfamily)